MTFKIKSIDKETIKHLFFIGMAITSIVVFFLHSNMSIRIRNELYYFLETHLPFHVLGQGVMWVLGSIIPFFVSLYFVNRVVRGFMISEHFDKKDIPFPDSTFKSQKQINEFVSSYNDLVVNLDNVAENYYRKSKYFVPFSLLYIVPLVMLLFVYLFSDYSLSAHSFSVETRGLIVFFVFFFGYFFDIKSFNKFIAKKKELKTAYQTAIFKCEEAKKQYDTYSEAPFLDPDHDDVSHKNGVVFQYTHSEYKGISVKSMYEHVFLIGPTGTGKSTKIIVPNMLNSHDHSLIINDESSELLKLVSTEDSYLSLERRQDFQKRKIKQLNPTRPDISLRWNPLSSIKSYNDAQRIAHCMINIGVAQKAENAFWNDQATLLLTIALYFLLLKEKQTSDSFLNFTKLKKILATPREEIKNLFVAINDERLIDDFMLGYGGG